MAIMLVLLFVEQPLTIWRHVSGLNPIVVGLEMVNTLSVSVINVDPGISPLILVKESLILARSSIIGLQERPYL